MQLVSTAHIENLLKDATRLGAILRVGEVERVCQTIQHHEYFTIASVEGRLLCEAVTVASDGEFLCVMIDTSQKQPLSWSRQNMNNFTGAKDDLSVICDTLEVVRKAYVQHLAQNMKVAA